MDAVIKNLQSAAVKQDNKRRPTQDEAEAAVRTLLLWAGDDPDREGLLDTPERVAKAYKELFSGYSQDPADVLGRTFEEIAGYEDIVLIQDIPFFSHCEHHMVPITGKAHVAYLPDGEKVVGLSKIARVVDIYAHRLQTQEAMTAQIANAIQVVIAAARRGRHDRSRAYVHVHARYSQIRFDDNDDDIHRHLQDRRQRTGAFHDPSSGPVTARIGIDDFLFQLAQRQARERRRRGVRTAL